MDINKRDALGTTMLFEAVANDDVSQCLKLLSAGADPNLGDNNGTTPLMEATSGGNEELVKLLLMHGALAGSRDRSGDTAADYARNQGFTGVAQILERDRGGD